MSHKTVMLLCMLYIFVYVSWNVRTFKGCLSCQRVDRQVLVYFNGAIFVLTRKDMPRIEETRIARCSYV